MSFAPQLVRYCDVAGFWRPFATLDTAGCVPVVVLLAVMGTLASLAHLYVWSVLTVYIRTRMEGPVDVVSARPVRVALLALAGILFLCAAIGKGVRERSVDPEGSHVFRMSNMEPDEAMAKDVWRQTSMSLLFNRIGDGHCYLEKNVFPGSRNRILWVELPFCSDCGKYAVPLSKTSCAADVYAFKRFLVSDYTGLDGKRRWGEGVPLDVLRLLPTDIQRKMTDEERARFEDVAETEVPEP